MFSGLLGAGIAAGEIYQERRYEEYVRAFIAQGQSLPDAQVAALGAMGLKVPPGTPTRRTYARRSMFWVVVGTLAVLFFAAALTSGVGGPTGAEVLIAVGTVGYCVVRLVHNLQHLG